MALKTTSFTLYIKYFILIIVISTSVHAQTGLIKGTIKDNQTEILLEDVLVNIRKTGNHTHTDDKGNFHLLNIPFGNYILELEKSGYEKQILKVGITNSDTVTLNVVLTSTFVNLVEVDVFTDNPVSAASSSYLSAISFINRPKNSAQDMLRLAPGLFIAQHAGGGKAEQIFIRGFDCDHGTDIATFVDGIPVNMPSHGHGQGYADLHFLIPEVVDGISVFKGTSSPLYGDFATGAAVGFKTYDSLPNNLIQTEIGSVPSTNALSSSRGLALVQLPIKNNAVSSYLAVDVSNNRSFFDIDQNFKRNNIFSKTTFYINNFSKVQFSIAGFGSSWDASGQIPQRSVKAGVLTRYGSIDPKEGGTTQRNNYNLTYTNKLGSGELETQAYVSSYRFKLFSNFTFFLEDTVNGDMIEQGDNRTVKGLNAKYTIGHNFFNKYNTFTLGASFRSDEIENQLWNSPERKRSKVRAHSLIHQRSNAIFINEVFRFNNQFRVELGARYDYFVFDVEDLLPTDSTRQNYSGFNYQSAINPKLNIIYAPTNKLQFFLNAGSGYHSNDARASVQDKNQHQLPLTVSAEIGSLFHLKKSVFSIALWGMDMNNELVYVGDDGTTENRGASRRYGIDISGRVQVLSWLFADIDVNTSKNRFIDTLFGYEKKENSHIPLAPTLTSSGGLTAKFKNGIECGARYRYIQNRPANENNTITALGYTVVDLNLNYKIKKYKMGLVIENLLNVNWNEAQFATETRLRNESTSTDELHFTPGTPFYAKLVLAYVF
jgi:outer membrane receptor for Fe3+-dicitrate